MANRRGDAGCIESSAHEGCDDGEAGGLEPEQDMRIGDEGQEPPVCLHEAEDGAVDDQTEIDPDRVADDVPEIGSVRSRWMKSSKRRKS